MMVKGPRLPSEPFTSDVSGGVSTRHMVFASFAKIVSEEGRALDESESVTTRAGFGNVLYVDPRDVYLRRGQANILR